MTKEPRSQHPGPDESAAEISGLHIHTVSDAAATPAPTQITAPPRWLMEPALAVLRDLQAPRPIAGLQIVASPIADLNGLTLGVLEPPLNGDIAELPDDLDPAKPTSYGGGNWVPRSLTGPELLVLIADLLQEGLAHSGVAWGQSRPPCPNHPHPARPAIHDREAWWICPHDNTPLYPIGHAKVQGALPTVAPPSAGDS